MPEVGSSTSTPTTTPPPQDTKTEEQKKAEEAQRSAQAEANKAKLAAEAAASELSSAKSDLSQEFLGLLDSIVQETQQKTEDKSIAQKKSDSSQPLNNSNQQFGKSEKDAKVLREFIREVKYMIVDKGIEIPKAINKLKTDQGGQFWQNVQQALQKKVTLQPGQQNPSELKVMQDGKVVGGELLAAKELLGEAAQQQGEMNPGQAILQLLRAETNFQAQKEQFLAALKQLQKDGLGESAKKLASYLRKKGLSDDELMPFGQEFRRQMYKRQEQAKKDKPFSMWSLFFGAGAFGVGVGMGMSIGEAAAVGVVMIVIFSLFNWVLKSSK